MHNEKNCASVLVQYLCRYTSSNAVQIATVRQNSYKNTQWVLLSGPGGSLLKSVTYKCLSLTCRCFVRNATQLLCFKPSPLLLQQMYSSINSKYTLRRQIIYLEFVEKVSPVFFLIRLYFSKTYQVRRLGQNCSCKENEMFRPQMHVSSPHAIKLIRSEDILIRHDMNSDLGHLSFMLFVIFSQRLLILFAFTLLIHIKICIL